MGNEAFHLQTPRFAVGKADPRLGLPASTIFEPVIVMHNFDANALDLTLTVGYGEGESAQHLNIPLSIQAGSTRVLSLHPYLEGLVPESDFLGESRSELLRYAQRAGGRNGKREPGPKA
jgi:hypothetical protein